MVRQLHWAVYLSLVFLSLAEAKKKKKRARDGSDDEEVFGTDHPMHPDHFKSGVGVGVGSAMVFPPWVLYLMGAGLLFVMVLTARELLAPKTEGVKGRKERKAAKKDA